MADKNSTQVANSIASPPILNDPGFNGILRVAYGEMTTDVIHADGDELRFCRVYSTWLCMGWRCVSADISATADLDIGLWRTDGGAVFTNAEDCFGVVDIATDVDTGHLFPDIALMPAAMVGKVTTFFELAGSPSGSETEWYDVVGQIETANTTIADLISVQIFYIEPGQ